MAASRIHITAPTFIGKLERVGAGIRCKSCNQQMVRRWVQHRSTAQLALLAAEATIFEALPLQAHSPRRVTNTTKRLLAPSLSLSSSCQLLTHFSTPGQYKLSHQRHWNKVPENIVNLRTHQAFKKYLKLHLFKKEKEN